MIEQMLKIAYERELELTEKLENPYTKHRWFVEDLIELNIDIQNRCLHKMGKQQKIKAHKESLH